MESLGNKLKTTRTEKGYDIDTVSRETNIAGKYLTALEEENFAVFPGEPYIIGFLRNYGEYLGLNGNELLALYRSHKLQEQPVPVEELLHSPSKAPKILAAVLIGALLLGLGGGGAYFFLRVMPRRPQVTEKARESEDYVMEEDTLERRFYRGDTVIIPLGEGDAAYKVEFTAHGDAVTLTAPEGPITLDLNQETEMDLDNSGVKSLRVTALEFAKNKPAAGALLRFEKIIPSPDAAAAVAQGAGSRDAPAHSTGSTVIFSSPSAFPFTLQCAFQTYCLFRWEVLFERNRQVRNEQYFQKSDEVSIEAQNGIRVWASNAMAVKLQVLGGGRTVPLELGGAGEVVAADIRWTRDEENRFRLALMRLD